MAWLATIAWAATTTRVWAIGDPASVYCQSRGGKVEIVAGANGGGRGVCVMRDGTRVDEWVYFRNTHRTTH